MTKTNDLTIGGSSAFDASGLLKNVYPDKSKKGKKKRKYKKIESLLKR